MFFSSTLVILLYLHVMNDIDDPQFNATFNKKFDNTYENMMNRIVKHINYHDCENNNNSYGDGGNDNYGNND